MGRVNAVAGVLGRQLSIAAGVLVTAGVGLGALGSPTAGATTAGPGITATTIKVGIPYVDYAAVDRQFELQIDQGSYPDAYNALIANLNAHGGVNGRRIVPVFVAINPTGAAAAATACTQLTVDDPVFVAMEPLNADCYLNHQTPTINSASASADPGAAHNFTLTPPAGTTDPMTIADLARMGVLKNKQVGVFGGASSDQPEMNTVHSALVKNHIRVVQTAVLSASATNQVAAAQEQMVIAQRFKNAGVDEVIAVGTGSSAWPQYEQQNLSTFTPPWVATSPSELLDTMKGMAFQPQYVDNVISTSSTPSQVSIWREPQVQRCVKIIKKAYPDDIISSPVGTSTGNPTGESYLAPESACVNLGLFVAMAKAAGKDLTTSTFRRGAYALKNVELPGSGAPVSFGEGKTYPVGPLYLARYDPNSKLLVFGSKPISG